MVLLCATLVLLLAPRGASAPRDALIGCLCMPPLVGGLVWLRQAVLAVAGRVQAGWFTLCGGGLSGRQARGMGARCVMECTRVQAGLHSWQQFWSPSLSLRWAVVGVHAHCGGLEQSKSDERPTAWKKKFDHRGTRAQAVPDHQELGLVRLIRRHSPSPPALSPLRSCILSLDLWRYWTFLES